MTFPTFQLNEPIIAQLLELLEAKLPAAIEALNATITDSITLDQPAQLLDYMPAPGELKAGVPAVCIQDLPAQFEDDLQFSITADHPIGIASVIQNADQRSLAWQLRRYTQAIAHVLSEDRLASDGGYLRRPPAQVWRVAFSGTEPGPLLGDRDPNAPDKPPSSFLSWTWLLIRARRQEV